MKQILLGVSFGLTSWWISDPPPVWYLVPLAVGVLVATLYTFVEQTHGMRHANGWVALLAVTSGLLSACNVWLFGDPWIAIVILPGMVVAMLAWFHLATWGWGTYTSRFVIPPLWRPGWVGKLARAMRWVGGFSFATTVLLAGLVAVQPDLDTTRFLMVLTISSMLVRALLHDPFTIRGVIRLPSTRTP